MLNRIEHPQSGIGIIVAQKNNFHRLTVGIVFVHGEQAFDKRKRHAFFQNIVLMFELVGAICRQSLFPENGIRFVKFKECTGCDSDHQFVFDLKCHL